MVEKLYRTEEAKAAGGFKSDSTFYAAVKTGQFPKPDGYIGPRSPFWTGETLRKHQAKLLSHKAAA
jgi:predicted DNA-binding transcriptional regulator AlpA